MALADSESSETFGSATKMVDSVDLDPVGPRGAMLLIAEPDNPQLED